MTAHGRLAQPSSMDAPGNLPEQPAQALCVGGTGILPVNSSPARVKFQFHPRRAGFTLVELLITVSVIAIMASMILFALFAAQETARVQKTKTLIAKLDAIIKAKYETYKTRRVPITVPPPPPPTPVAAYKAYTAMVARMRLDGLRELMRMELPDRWTDIVQVNFGGGVYTVTTTPAAPITAIASPPSVWNGYLRRVQAAPSVPSMDFQGAECLYMIVMAAQAEEADDRSAIRPDSIADIDNDGFPEFIDAWRQPIRFLRWAPGFISDLQVVAVGTVTNVTLTDPHVHSFTATGRLAGDSGSYVGGAIIKRDLATQQFSTDDIGYIGAYTVSGGTTSISCTTPDYTPQYTRQRPFRGGGGMAPGYDFFVLAPDPFDPQHVYPVYNGTGAATAPVPDTSIATFALYPLIYSSGPDKAYGIVSDAAETDPFTPLSYAVTGSNVANPFHILSTNQMIGRQAQVGSEPDRGWLDNIHNHMITAR